MLVKFAKLGLTSAIILSTLGIGEMESTAKTINYKTEILNYQPGLSKAELEKTVDDIAKQTKKSKNVIYKEIYKEAKANDDEGKKELKKYSIKPYTAVETANSNSSEGTDSKHYINYSKLKKKFKSGQIFYTPSYLAIANHGHVGMIYNSQTIVESISSAGVRKISIKKKKVDNKGAVLKNVEISSSKRKAAAEWAYSRVGKDGYSTNFVTNRKTSYYGNKNCSKLVWSAYKLKAKIDLDDDGGTGVYPRDVRDAKETKFVANI